MAFLAAAAPYIAAATTVVGAYSSIQQGKAQEANQKLIALQQEREANETQVEAQRQAQQERKRAKYVRSRAIAVAGASGAGVSDPTVSDILSDIDTEGEMNALNALWSGDATASSLRAGAGARRRSGRAASTAGYTSAATTALRGGVQFNEDYPTFFSKYG